MRAVSALTALAGDDFDGPFGPPSRAMWPVAIG
jgi:hypothetical protein